MLTQAMAKSVLSYAMSKNEKNVIKHQVTKLDRYISAMRTQYAKGIVKTAKHLNIPLSISPDHTHLPFPATFTRMVNDRFSQSFSGQTDIISKNPINPEQKLRTQTDHKAYDSILKNPNQMYSAFETKNGHINQVIYTADIASVQACVNCHRQFQGDQIKLGSLLGIRRYTFEFSKNEPVGKQILNSNLDEFELNKAIFQKTLHAIKEGGEYPRDLKMSTMGHFEAIENPTIQQKIIEVEKQFTIFKSAVKQLLNNQPGTDDYRSAIFMSMDEGLR